MSTEKETDEKVVVELTVRVPEGITPEYLDRLVDANRGVTGDQTERGKLGITYRQALTPPPSIPEKEL